MWQALLPVRQHWMACQAKDLNQQLRTRRRTPPDCATEGDKAAEVDAYRLKFARPSAVMGLATGGNDHGFLLGCLTF